MSFGPHVELGMYPFESVAWAWDEIWAAVHTRAPWTPESLTRSGDVHARWYDSDCIVTQVCGWPFAAVHRNDMHLVGAFALALPDGDSDAHGRYQSVVLAPRTGDLGDLDDLVTPATHAVANSADSLSGWLSLLASTVGIGGEWPGTVTYTSAHHDSLRALAAGEADLACIDSWSLALIAREEPELVAGLRRVGRGPLVPTPAITARKSISLGQLDDLQRALAGALDDAATADARAALFIAGVAATSLDDYLTTLTFGPAH